MRARRRRSSRSGRAAEGTGSAAETDRWTVSYADLLTLLFAFFASLYAMANARAGTVVPEAPPSEEPVIVAVAAEPPQCPVAEDLAYVGPIQAAWVPTTPTVEFTEEQLALRYVLAEAMQGLASQPALIGRATLSPDPRGVRLSLGATMLFEPGDRRVRDSAREALALLGDALGRVGGEVVIEGHTDDTPVRGGTYRSNWELSTARATEVLEILVEAHGIPPRRMSAAGYGEYRPAASNATDAGRALNRRIDVVISADSGTKP